LQNVDPSSLSQDHQWYAMTKLACEQIVRQQSHTILRIWDIK
jgi:nucleoside-diphosphate-sugar epimerase